MFQKIILQCRYRGEQRANYNWGSIFHGLLLQALPPKTAAALHQSQLRPFSQYVLPHPDQQLLWKIGLWDAETADQITRVLLPLTKLELKQKGTTLEVTEIQRAILSEADFFSQFFTEEKPCRRYEIEFLTPCNHKQDGEYSLFPSPKLIVNSLNKRYGAFVKDISLDDPEAMEQIAAHLRIVRYNLRSAVYYLENTKITGYLGKITLVITGPEQLARVAGALLSFAEYSGLGIKTALGMGGVSVKRIPSLETEKA